MKSKISEAYKYCHQLSQHYENFPVGSILLPKKIRKHFYALYAFMRTADDYADLPTRSKAERLELLADWRRQLDEVIDSRLSIVNSQSQIENPIFLALNNTISECKLDPKSLFRLLEAFGRSGRARRQLRDR